jgi:hypothetical protein
MVRFAKDRRWCCWFSVLLLGCTDSRPDTKSAVVGDQEEVSGAAQSCAPELWTVDRVHRQADKAFAAAGLRYEAADLHLDERSLFGIFPAEWPPRTCRVVLYLYYARDATEDSRGIETAALGTPLLAAAVVDLRSGDVAVESLGNPDETVRHVVFGAPPGRGIDEAAENSVLREITHRDLGPAATEEALGAYGRRLDQCRAFSHVLLRRHTDFVVAALPEARFWPVLVDQPQSSPVSSGSVKRLLSREMLE